MRCSDALHMVVTEGRTPYGASAGGGCGLYRALARHLEMCEACREEAETYGRDADLIRRACEQQPIPEDFTAAVMKRIRSG